DEVTKTGELSFFQRGEKAMIGIYPGRRLDNPYSGNVVDICPVGALTLKEFRFETRVWYLKNTPSICAGCARGCNVMVAVGKQQEMWTTRDQFDDRIKRLVPRVNEDVNGHWMCDEGRLSYRRQLAVDRLASAQAPAGAGKDWEEAVGQVAELLKSSAPKGRAAAIFSPRLVSETYFAWRRLFEQLGNVPVGVHRLVRGKDDNLLVRADKGANTRGAGWVLGDCRDTAAILEQATGGQLDTLLIFGDPLDPEDTPPVDDELRSKVRLIYIGSFLDATAQRASLLLPAAAWAEEDGSFVNFEGRVQWTRRCHLPCGESRPGWRIAAEVAEEAGVGLPPWTSAADVLEALASSVEPFNGMTESDLGLLGVKARPAAEVTS
ncbi:MAG: molybdopterin-dependent oxidoreductase, partial [Planctomycetota bacterium]